MKTRVIVKSVMVSTAVCALALGLNLSHGAPSFTSQAFAEEGSGHTGSGDDHGSSGHKGGQSGKGQGSGTAGHGANAGKGVKDKVFEEGEGPSSDAKGPAYMGGKATTGKPGGAGTKKGDTFGDMWVIERNADGTPKLTPEGFVQPLDKNGNPIPLDAEGAPIDPSLVVEVELSRLNVGRSPSKVLDRQLTDAVNQINSADSVSLDASGRIVTTTNGEAKTIDSPLANLALYTALVSSGSIPGLDPAKLGNLSYLADGTRTSADLMESASLLAAAGDKTGSFNVDTVEYLNSIVRLNGTITGTDGKTYIDYSSVTYDRATTYSGEKVQVLVETSPGMYETKTVDVYEAVFGSKDASGTNAEGFAQAVDDARAVLLYVHDNAPR